MARVYPLRLTCNRALSSKHPAKTATSPSGTLPVASGAPLMEATLSERDIQREVFRSCALPRLTSLKRESSGLACAEHVDVAVALRDIPPMLKQRTSSAGAVGAAPQGVALRPGTLLQHEGGSLRLAAGTAGAVHSTADLRSGAAVALMRADMASAGSLRRRLKADVSCLRARVGEYRGGGPACDSVAAPTGDADSRPPRGLLESVREASARWSAAMQLQEMASIEGELAEVLARRAKHNSGAVCATAVSGSAPLNGVTVTAAAPTSEACGSGEDGDHMEDVPEEGEAEAIDTEMVCAAAEEDGEIGAPSEAQPDEGGKAAESALVKLAATAMVAAAEAAADGGGPTRAKCFPTGRSNGSEVHSDGAAVAPGAVTGIPYDAKPDVLEELHSRPWIEEGMRKYTRAPQCAEWAKEIAQARRRHPLRCGRAVTLPGATGGVVLTPVAEPPAAPQLLTAVALCVTERAVRQDRRNIGQVVKEIKVRPWIPLTAGCSGSDAAHGRWMPCGSSCARPPMLRGCVAALGARGSGLESEGAMRCGVCFWRCVAVAVPSVRATGCRQFVAWYSESVMGASCRT